MSSLRNSTSSETPGKYEEIFRRANEAIFLVDPRRDALADCNERACELFECSREELLSLSPDDLVPYDRVHAQEAFEAVVEKDASCTDEIPCITCSGEEIRVWVSLSRIDVDGQAYVLIIARDRSETTPFEAVSNRHAAAIDSIAEGVAIVDADYTLVYVNRALLDMHGYDDPTALAGRPVFDLYDDDERQRFEERIVPTVEFVGDWRGELCAKRRDESSFTAELSVSSLDDGSFVLTCRDVSHREVHARTLEALTEATQSFMAAEDKQSIAEIAIEFTETVLGYDIACIRLYDEATNRLEPVATTDEADILLDTYQAFDLELSSAGRAYRTGERIEHSQDDVTCPGSGATASVHLPLGEIGTLTVFARTATVEELDVRCLDILAANMSTALERTEREERLRASETELDQQRAELETLDQINTLIQQSIKRVVNTPDREAIYQTVCEAIATSRLYESAWIGTVETNNGRITSAEGAGVDEGFLEVVESAPLTQLANGTVAEAIRTETIQVTRQYLITDSPVGGVDEVEPAVPQAEAMAAVPITSDERMFGVLVVTTDREDAFSDRALTSFEMLGHVLGFVIGATLNRELLHADTVVELEFSVGDEKCLPAALSAELDARCRVEKTTRSGDGDSLCYLSIEGTSSDAVRGVADDLAEIETYRIVDAQGGQVLIELVARDSPVEVLASMGASTPTIIGDGGEARIVVEGLPGNSRTIADALTDLYDDAELVAKREYDRAVRTTTELRQQLENSLTDRQCAAIETAYTAGYYDYPRKSTAEELANAMGISAATFHQHLRKAERKVLDAMLDQAHEQCRETN